MPFFTTPCITVTSPGGGENWKVGSIRTIKWTSSNLSSGATISILYWVGTWRIIVENLPNYSSSNSWKVPNAPTAGARIKVVSTVNGVAQCSGVSNTFTISA